MVNWKIIAIIFITLFVIETSYVFYAVYAYNHELDKTNICFYDICSEHPDAEYYENVCYCYDYDLMGELVVVKSEYMK